jgi:hypothetical protein
MIPNRGARAYKGVRPLATIREIHVQRRREGSDPIIVGDSRRNPVSAKMRSRTGRCSAAMACDPVDRCLSARFATRSRNTQPPSPPRLRRRAGPTASRQTARAKAGTRRPWLLACGGPFSPLAGSWLGEAAPKGKPVHKHLFSRPSISDVHPTSAPSPPSRPRAERAERPTAPHPGGGPDLSWRAARGSSESSSYALSEVLFSEALLGSRSGS